MGSRPVVDRREVERVAGLAHVTLDDEEKRALTSELNAIVAHFRKLERLDVTGVEPSTHSGAASTRLRDDEVGASLPVERVLGGAPQPVGDNFGVPRVLD